ncbi:hypothetical protein MXB_3022 [Myxobolus squamalis]|nr:hypothetical protein MXB_3022 [Myxobolus squamalis]
MLCNISYRMITPKSSDIIEILRKQELGETDSLDWIYNCICGVEVLIIDKSISSLALRERDNARIFKNTQAKKVKYAISNTVYIKRETGVEPQIRLECPKCHLPLFYRHEQNPDITFIINDSLVSTRIENVRPKIVSVVSKAVPKSLPTSVVAKPNNEGPSSYSYNAAIINNYLQKRKIPEDNSECSNRKKKIKGTLLDH